MYVQLSRGRMKLINPSFEIISKLDGEEILRHCEIAVRNCYKSEDKIGDDSHTRVIKTVVDSHHYSTLEHSVISIRVICSRACMSQWTRHRHLSYSIESQRYCNYTKGKFNNEISFIKPANYYNLTTEQKFLLDESFKQCEANYLKLVYAGFKAQDARQVLNNAVKTEMVITGNLRAWREFLKLRTEPHAQDEIRFLSIGLLNEFKKNIPIVFDSINPQ